MEEKYITWYVSTVSCSLIINYSIFIHSRTLLLLWYLLQDLSPFLLLKALMWLRKWKLVKDGAARNTDQKQICSRCTRPAVCRHPSTELAVRLCSSVAKGSTSDLQGFLSSQQWEVASFIVRGTFQEADANRNLQHGSLYKVLLGCGKLRLCCAFVKEK